MSAAGAVKSLNRRLIHKLSFSQQLLSITICMYLKPRKQKYKAVVEDWIQEHMNCWFLETPCDEPCLGCKLRIPGLADSLLVPEMRVQGIQEIEDASEGPGYTLLMNVELKNVKGFETRQQRNLIPR